MTIKLPKELTTVTPLSKTLALLLFITLPICGFFLGMNYQQTIGQGNQQQTVSPILENKRLMPSPDVSATDTSSWKTYNNLTYGFEMQYPNMWKAAEQEHAFGTGQLLITINGKDGRNKGHVIFIQVHDNSSLQSNLKYRTVTSFYKALSQKLQNTTGLTDPSAYAPGSDNPDPWFYTYDVTTELPIIVGKNSALLVTSTDKLFAYVLMLHNNLLYEIILQPYSDYNSSLIQQIISTFTFANQNQISVTTTPTCMPRPACLDATPRCLIAEPAQGWCSL